METSSEDEIDFSAFSSYENDGKDLLGLTYASLSISCAYNYAVESSTGAVSMFIGTTRDSFENKKVTKLSYEAYEPMAMKELKKICEAVRTTFNVHKICVLHRLGEVPIKQASVVVAVSSPHRKESLEAVQILIDTLKEKVPIWKKEIYEDGGSNWKENNECGWK